jgi:hypothetical protein
LRLDEADDTAILGPVFVVSWPAPIRQAVELSLGVLYRILQHFLGPAWTPYAVWFTHPAPRRGEWHRRLFGATVEFEQDFDGIVWPARDLDLPVVGARKFGCSPSVWRRARWPCASRSRPDYNPEGERLVRRPRR